jgi:hypothetical protein
VHGDADGDPAVYYEIEVNTTSDFTGTVIWDSNQTSMTSTANTVRSPDISYAGTTPAWSTLYYWRIRFTDNKGATSSWSTTQTFTMNAVAATPTLSSPTNSAINISLTPTLQTVTTDADSDYLRYKIQLCTTVGMTTGCQTFDQTSSQTGWSGQNAQTSTAYTSGTTASYTLTSSLTLNTNYYWRSYAIDPAGTNTWSTTQSPVYSFTTRELNESFACLIHETANDSSLTITWTDREAIEDDYRLEKSTDGAAFSAFQTLAANTVTYQDTSITQGHTYQYRVAPYYNATTSYGDWCTTSTLSIQSGTFKFENLNFR